MVTFSAACSQPINAESDAKAPVKGAAAVAYGGGYGGYGSYASYRAEEATREKYSTAGKGRRKLARSFRR